jgi:hypothetical protein
MKQLATPNLKRPAMRLVEDGSGSKRQPEPAHQAPGVAQFHSGDSVILRFGDRGANPSTFVAFRKDRLWVDIRHPDGTVAPYSVYSIRPSGRFP